jgi:hypothetical protein
VPFSLLTAPQKNPDAALRRILRHCGVRQVLLIPQDLRALPVDFFYEAVDNGQLLNFIRVCH